MEKGFFRHNRHAPRGFMSRSMVPAEHIQQVNMMHSLFVRKMFMKHVFYRIACGSVCVIYCTAQHGVFYSAVAATVYCSHARVPSSVHNCFVNMDSSGSQQCIEV